MEAREKLFEQFKLLTPEHAALVEELVKELNFLTRLEDARDNAIADQVMAEIGDDILRKTTPWEELKAKLDEIHGHDCEAGEEVSQRAD